ncbi:Myb/SANT-like domain-containing protein [Arachis hypogaea]|nr:Myb/SANT-like domain-containing protein [Arachis hypogaea]
MASIPRQWTEQETEQFVVFMEKLVVEGKRTDAGQFKPGAFQKLADKMNEKFPGCGLTVKYIRNKHKRLKEKYMFVAEMLGCSGFGWNSEKMRVEVDSKQVLEAWGKVVAMLHYTPGKPFPLFEPLRSIFGKDRATGLDAYSGKDAEEDVILGSTFAVATSSGLGLGGDNVDMEDLAAAESELPNTFSTSFASSNDKNQGRKHVQVLANAMSGVDEQVNLGRTLKSLGFTTIEIVQIAKKIVQNPELKATFWSLDEEKEAFARDIMDNF